jgi:beta-xylosidase
MAVNSKGSEKLRPGKEGKALTKKVEKREREKVKRIGLKTNVIHLYFLKFAI